MGRAAGGAVALFGGPRLRMEPDATGTGWRGAGWAHGEGTKRVRGTQRLRGPAAFAPIPSPVQPLRGTGSC